MIAFWCVLPLACLLGGAIGLYIWMARTVA